MKTFFSYIIAAGTLLTLSNCTGFSALTQSSLSSTSSFRLQNATPTKYGMFYLVWHCGAQPVQDISLGQLGAFGSFHWWGKPDAGYYCPTRDRDVLRHHAELLRDAGIDFVYIDGTNFADAGNPQAQQMLLEPLKAVMEEFSKVQGAPKVSVWTPLSPGGTVPDAVDDILSQYPQMLFVYQGKPLMEVVENEVFSVDQALWNRFAAKYTLRKMWVGRNAPTEWSFMSPCQANFKASNGTGPCNQRVAVGPDGQVEQISITAAYQNTFMSDYSTAVPKFGGRTLQAQFKNVDLYPNAPLVMITGWNEWIAQRFCINHGVSINCSAATQNTIGGNPIFVDALNAEYSRDIEPGGGQGDAMYQILKTEIANRKMGQINIVGSIDSIVGANDQVVLQGWACATSMSDAVAVHVYAGGAAGAGGHMIGSGTANVASETAVGAACADPTNSPHRFSIVFDAATANASAGQTIFVHGLSPVGRSNLTIAGSGAFVMPILASTAVVVPQPTVVQELTVVQQPTVVQPTVVQPTVVQPPPVVENWAEIHRFYNRWTGEHFFTASYAEGVGAGFDYEGVGFHVLSNQVAGSHPIFRCITTEDEHFVSTDANCEGQRTEGTYGYLYDQPAAGRSLLYRLFNDSSHDHLSSYNSGEGVPYYRLEGGLGYSL